MNSYKDRSDSIIEIQKKIYVIFPNIHPCEQLVEVKNHNQLAKELRYFHRKTIQYLW
jgi:hypothetical protein